MSDAVGYDLARVEELRRSTLRSIEDLRGRGHGDPAAEDAVAAVRAVLHTLEELWMPTIDRIVRLDPLGDDGDRDDAFTDAMRVVVAPRSFPPTTARRLLGQMLQVTSHVDDVQTRHDAAVAERLLQVLLAHPALLLDLLSDRAAVRELIQWPFVDPDLVATAVLTGLLAPDLDAELVVDGQLALRNFVGFANEGVFEEGFGVPLAEALAVAFAKYAPLLVVSMEEGDAVNIKDADGWSTNDDLGSHEEVLDFLGALLRDAAAADVLLGSVGSLAAASQVGDPTPTFTIHDVGDYALALVHAAENEQLEEELRAAARRALVERISVVVGIAATVTGVAIGASTTARGLVTELVHRAGDHVAGRIDADEATSLDGGAVSEILIELALCESFLADPDHFAGDGTSIDEVVLSRARGRLDDLHTALAEGVSTDAVTRALEDIQRDILLLGGRTFLAPLDQGSIRKLDGRSADPDLG